MFTVKKTRVRFWEPVGLCKDHVNYKHTPESQKMCQILKGKVTTLTLLKQFDLNLLILRQLNR